MRPRQLSPKRIVLSLITVTSALLFSSIFLGAQDARADNFVYLMTNESPRNSVIQFARGTDGPLT